MRNNSYFIHFIVIVLIAYSENQKLDLTDHKSSPVKISTGSWMDLLGYKLECPNNGILKNFVLRKNKSEFWYEFQCYSSKQSGTDTGEPIIKCVTSYNYNYHNKKPTSNIQTLNNFNANCYVDWGLSAFSLNKEKDSIKVTPVCHALKISSASTSSVKTNVKTANSNSIDSLTDIFVGRTDKETNTDIGFPLRGFKIVVDTTKSTTKPDVYILYSYTKLRNMEVVRNSYIKQMENFRNKNDQID